MPQIQQPPPVGFQDNPLTQSLLRAIEHIQANPTQPVPWGMHEPTLDAAAGVEEGLQGAGNVLADPRNSWMGFGPLAMATRPAGWGAEILRRYKLLGGTPETLNKTLMRRGLVHPEDRQDIVGIFKKATDIAGPGAAEHPVPQVLQNMQMNYAGKLLQESGHPRPMQYGFSDNLITEYPQRSITSMNLTPFEGIESGSKGNAAYGATSRQAQRMFNTPGFQFSRPIDLPPVSEAEYYKRFPIEDPHKPMRRIEGDAARRYNPDVVRQVNEEADRFNFGRIFGGQHNELYPGTPAATVREQIMRDLGLAGVNARPNYRLDTIRGGPPTAEDFEAARRTQPWPRNE